VNAGSYWRERLEQYQLQPDQGSAAVLEVHRRVRRIEDLIGQFSPQHIEPLVKRLPEREVWVMVGRSEGRIYQDMARELGVTVGLVRTLYGRGLKRCISYLLDSVKPDGPFPTQ
jgi:DNA-directed RNA polymerase specialized sigma24 family protein